MQGLRMYRLSRDVLRLNGLRLGLAEQGCAEAEWAKGCTCAEAEGAEAEWAEDGWSGGWAGLRMDGLSRDRVLRMDGLQQGCAGG